MDNTNIERSLTALKSGKITRFSGSDITNKLYLEAVPSRIKKSVQFADVILKTIDVDDQLVKFVGLPTTKVKNGEIHTGAFLIKGDIAANKVIKSKDLCSGVSAYEIDSLGEYTRKHQDDIHDFVTEKLKSFCNTAFIDHSIDFSNNVNPLAIEVNSTDEATTTNEIKEKKQLSLGSINSSVGVYKMFDHIAGKIHWYIVVRTYSQKEVNTLYNYIQSPDSPTIKQVVESNLYKEAINASDKMRTDIAIKLAKVLGMTLKAVTSNGIDNDKIITNHYNYIKQTLYSDGKLYYCYYEKCFDFLENRIGVMFGLNRADGYQIVYNDAVRQDAKIRNQNNEFINAYPMGLSGLYSREDLMRVLTASKTSPEEQKQLISRGHPGHVIWGGHYGHNYKAIPDLYISKNTVEEGRWKKYISKLVPIMYLKTGYLLTDCVYISSASATETSIQEIILFTAADEKVVKIPLSNGYMREHFMHDYITYKSKNKNSGENKSVYLLAEVIVGETEHFFLVDRRWLEILYSGSSYRSL